jgi:hypothetical protein
MGVLWLAAELGGVALWEGGVLGCVWYALFCGMDVRARGQAGLLLRGGEGRHCAARGNYGLAHRVVGAASCQRVVPLWVTVRQPSGTPPGFLVLMACAFGGVVPLSRGTAVVLLRREEILQYQDPTIMHKLQLQLAIAEERFDDAAA